MVKETEKTLRHSKLSWKLIEAKILYYSNYSELDCATRITDQEYDELEVEYLTLCKNLKKPNTIVHKGYPGLDLKDLGQGMMEVNWERPSVRLALDKLLNKYSSKRKRKKT